MYIVCTCDTVQCCSVLYMYYMYNTIQYYMSLVYKQQTLYTPSDVHNSHLILSVGICSPLQQQPHSLMMTSLTGHMESSPLVL